MRLFLFFKDVTYISVMDAYGKPESGIFTGDWKWLGSYDECLKVEAQVYTSAMPTTLYQGQYCKAKFNKIDTLLQGLPVGAAANVNVIVPY